MYIEAPLHGIRDRMLAVRALPNFHGLSDDSLLQIVEHARERRFRAGEELLVEGQPVEHIYIVINGAVTTSRDGKTFLVITDNGAVGILSAFAQDPHGWHAVADRDTLTLEIPAAVFLASVREDFGLLRNALRAIGTMALTARGHLPTRPDPKAVIELGVNPERDPTLVERILALRTQPAFRTANMDALIELCRRMQLMRVDAGHVVFSVGEPSSFSVRIIYGRVRCTADTGEHVDVGAGQVLGALDAWSAAPRSYGAIAETQVVAYRTRTEDFLGILENHPTVAMSVIKVLAASLIQGGLRRT